MPTAARITPIFQAVGTAIGEHQLEALARRCCHDDRQRRVGAHTTCERLDGSSGAGGITAIENIIGAVALALPDDVEIAGAFGKARIFVVAVAAAETFE